MKTVVHTFTVRPIREMYEIPDQARGSEVGIIMLLRMLRSPQQVAMVTRYHPTHVYRVMKKYNIRLGANQNSETVDFV